eukprot:TRINITY_DN264_c2_g3_i2.p1 TRINITY_DN264_c2_g3~~TRINITY_DN264_c2_g3_i2.p1  ORF type:complete len:218 (-),score=-13.92 TRINITY_DN264_c2_g3_i2:440-1093(-)
MYIISYQRWIKRTTLIQNCIRLICQVENPSPYFFLLYDFLERRWTGSSFRCSNFLPAPRSNEARILQNYNLQSIVTVYQQTVQQLRFIYYFSKYLNYRAKLEQKVGNTVIVLKFTRNNYDTKMCTDFQRHGFLQRELQEKVFSISLFVFYASTKVFTYVLENTTFFLLMQAQLNVSNAQCCTYYTSKCVCYVLYIVYVPTQNAQCVFFIFKQLGLIF